VVIPKFWLTRRGSTSSNMGVGSFCFCCYLLCIVASLFTSFSPTLSLHYFLTDPPLHHKTRSHSPKHRRGESEWITRSLSPKHRRGQSEWIRFRLMDSPTFSSTSRSACFGDLHASTSAHHHVYTGGSLLQYIISKCGHPRKHIISNLASADIHV